MLVPEHQDFSWQPVPGAIALFCGPVWGGKSAFLAGLSRQHDTGVHALGGLFPVRPEAIPKAPVILLDDLHAWFRYKRLRRSDLAGTVAALLKDGAAIGASWLGQDPSLWPAAWPAPALWQLVQPGGMARGSAALVGQAGRVPETLAPSVVRAVRMRWTGTSCTCARICVAGR